MDRPSRGRLGAQESGMADHALPNWAGYAMDHKTSSHGYDKRQYDQCRLQDELGNDLAE